MIGVGIGLSDWRVPSVGGDPYGPNLVENGTFTGDDATGWTVTRVSIGGEKLAMVNTSGLTGNATYTIPAGLEDSVDYLVEWDVSEFVAAGGVTRNIVLGGTNSALASGSMADGHFSVTVNAGATTEVLRINSNNNDDYKIDNVSVRKVL